MKTWQIYDERYPADDVTIEEIGHDYDLHAFQVSYLGEVIGTIYPDTIEQMDEIVTALNSNESPIGWEDGMGETISVGIWGTIDGIRYEAMTLAGAGWTADDRDDLLIIYDLTEKQVDLLIECWDTED